MGTRQIIEDDPNDESSIVIRSKIERQLYVMKELLDEVEPENEVRINHRNIF